MEKFKKFISSVNGQIACLLLILWGCQPVGTHSVTLLITNVNVVDVANGRILEKKDVAIRGDSIAYVENANAMDFSARQIIDGSGHYLLPGLWDNHVHFRGGDTLINENKDLLPLYLDYGVTTVRDAGGDITPSVLEWREAIDKGDLEGPTLFTSGPKLDGPGRAWPGSIAVDSDRAVQAALDSLEKLEVDYVKLYDYSLAPQIYYRIIEEATRRGYKTTGHMPMAAYLREAIQRGLTGTEHTYYVLKGCSAKEDSLTALGRGYGILSDLVDTYDVETASALFALLAEKQCYITPTFYIGKVLGNLYLDDHSDDSLLKAIPAGIRRAYEGRVASARRAGAAGAEGRMDMLNQSQKMVLGMKEAGVPVLAGSDCGPYNSFVYPGEALHGELRELVAAGFSPAEALQSSVIRGPEFFDYLNSYGSVEVGKLGDLLLVKANPLENIEHLTKIRAVIKKGKLVRGEVD